MAGAQKYLLIGAACAGLALAYMIKQAASKAADDAKQLAQDVADAAGKAAQAVNPFNNENIINKGATDLYQWTTGSTGDIGGDLWDYLHKAEPVPGSGPGLVNYTPEQQQRDLEATRQLEAGFHGM